MKLKKIINSIVATTLLSIINVVSCNPNVNKEILNNEKNLLSNSKNKHKKYKISINNKVIKFNTINEALSRLFLEYKIKEETKIGKKIYKNFYNELLINEDIQKFDLNKIENAYLNAYNQYNNKLFDAYNSYLPDSLITKKYIDHTNGKTFNNNEEAVKSIADSLNKSFNKILVKHDNNFYNIFSKNDIESLKKKLIFDRHNNQSFVFEYKNKLIFVSNNELENIYEHIASEFERIYEKSTKNIFKIDFKVLTENEEYYHKYWDSWGSYASFDKWGDWTKKDDYWIYKHISKKWLDKYIRDFKLINGENVDEKHNCDLEDFFDYYYDNYNVMLHREYHNSSMENNKNYLDFSTKNLKISTHSTYYNWFTLGYLGSYNPAGFFNYRYYFNTRFNFFFFIELMADKLKEVILNNIGSNFFNKFNYSDELNEFLIEKTKELVNKKIEQLIWFDKIKIQNKGREYILYINDKKIESNSIVKNNFLVLRNKIRFLNENKAYSFKNAPFFYKNKGKDINLTKFKVLFNKNDQIFLLDKNQFKFDEYIKQPTKLMYYETSENVSDQYLSKYFSSLNNNITSLADIKDNKELWYLKNPLTSLSFGNIEKSYQFDYTPSIDFTNLQNFNLIKKELKNNINPNYTYEAETINTIMTDEEKLLIKNYYNFAYKDMLKMNYLSIKPELAFPSSQKIFYKLNSGKRILLDLNVFNTFFIELDKKYTFDKYSNLKNFLIDFINNKKEINN